MDNKELAKQLAWQLAVMIICIIILSVMINRFVTTSIEEVKKVGLKNIVEEVWEGKATK